MKSCHTYGTHWTILVGMLVFVREILAQEEFSRAEPCEGDNNWIDDYRRQEDRYNDLLVDLIDAENSLRHRNRNRMYGGLPPFEQLLDGRRIFDYGLRNLATPISYEIKRDPNGFSSWEGKRHHENKDDSPKREAGFSSWGGKRTQKFFNWGGKRSLDTNAPSGGPHRVMKRSVGSSHQSRGKRLCITDEMNLQELFKEFIDWSRKQPEQKKSSIYRKMFGVSTLHSPDNVSRRAGSFFQWGGKRNSKNSDLN